MMMVKENFMVMMMTLFFLITYIFNKYHVMNNLIISEYVVATLLITMFNVVNMTQMENYLVFYILVILISESVLGLSLMVNLIRTHTNDFMKSMTLMKF